MRRTTNHILATLTICHLAGCKGESPEAQVRKAFEGCVRAVEAGDAAGATEVLAKNFQGVEGLDKAGARLYLMALFRREKVGITVFGNQIKAEDTRAEQVLELLLTSKGGGLLPQEASRRTYRLHWRLEGSQWRLERLEEGS